MDKINIEEKWTEWWDSNAPIHTHDNIYWLVKKAYEFGIEIGLRLSQLSPPSNSLLYFRQHSKSEAEAYSKFINSYFGDG